MSTRTSHPAARFVPERETLLWGAIVINAELMLLAAWALVTGTELTGPLAVRYWLYPLVWINVGVWAIVRTKPAPAGTRQRRIALAIAVGYFGVLAYFGGLVGASTPGPASLSVTLFAIPPGWGPALLYNGSTIAVTLLPYQVVGYVALAYLVYATVLDAAGSAVTGALGLLSCVSCTWPVIASLVTGVVGSGTALATAVYTQSYDLSTVVFVVTVALLYWRPFGR